MRRRLRRRPRGKAHLRPPACTPACALGSGYTYSVGTKHGIESPAAHRLCREEGAEKEGEAGGSEGPALSLWGMASALRESVKAKTAELAASIQETDWKAELGAFQAGLKEDSDELQKKTKEAVEHLPAVVGQLKSDQVRGEQGDCGGSGGSRDAADRPAESAASPEGMRQAPQRAQLPAPAADALRAVWILPCRVPTQCRSSPADPCPAPPVLRR